MAETSSPICDVEVRLHVRKARFGLRRWHGTLSYRCLATRGHLVSSFWLEQSKRDGLGGEHPLARARTRACLVEKLHRHAERLGNVVSCTEVGYG
jgi:hypothetical protein